MAVLLTCICALIGSLGFIFPQSAWFLAGSLILPAVHDSIAPFMRPFLQGFFWGIILHGLVGVELFSIFYLRAQGGTRMVFPLLFFVCNGLCSGLWFWTASRLGSRINKTNLLYVLPRLLIWLLLLPLYIMFVVKFFFVPLGQWHGNPFLNPYLLIIARRELKEPPNALCKRMVVLLPCFEGLHNISDLVIRIKRHEKLTLAHGSSIKDVLFIIPESGLPFILNNGSKVIRRFRDVLEQNGLKETKILAGTHATDGIERYNSLMYIKNCRIIERYDKNKLCLLTEITPWPLSIFSTIESLFSPLQNQKNKHVPRFSSGKERFKLFTVDNITFIPLICSEFFLADNFVELESQSRIPLLCIANDSWFGLGIIPYLMELQAFYQARRFKRPVIYISHTRALWINSDGSFFQLTKA